MNETKEKCNNTRALDFISGIFFANAIHMSIFLSIELRFSALDLHHLQDHHIHTQG